MISWEQRVKLIDEYRALLKKRNTIDKMTEEFLETCEELGRKGRECIENDIDIPALNKMIDMYGEYIKEGK